MNAGPGKENAKCGRRIGKQRETPLVRAWKTESSSGKWRRDGGGIHTRTESTRFTLRGNSGVHSRTSKSENSISVNRSWWTWGRDERGREREREWKRSTIRAQMMEFTIISFDVANDRLLACESRRACVNIVLSGNAHKSRGFCRSWISRDTLCSLHSLLSPYDFLRFIQFLRII